MDNLVDSVKNLIINDAKYYESTTATASSAQGGFTSNPETATEFWKKNIELPYHPCLDPSNKPACDEGNLRHRATHGRPGLHDELVGLASTESPQAELKMILALLKRPPQI